MSFMLKPVDEAESINESVVLYLPSSIGVSDGATYTGLDLANVAGIRSLKNKTIEDADVIARSNRAAGALGETFKEAMGELGMSLGIASNPFTNLAFEGMSPRTWSFEFKLISESEDEAKEIRDIENWFRKNMYAEKIGNLALRYPTLIRTQFWEGENESEYLPMIMDSYITSLAVTYNESNSMYHEKGAPIETSISLSLSENKTLTRRDLYQKGSLKSNRLGRDNVAKGDAVEDTTLKSQAIKEENRKVNQNEGPE